MRWLALLAMCASCAPMMIGGPGRVLPVALQYDPASFAGKPVPHKVENPRRVTLPNGVEVLWMEDHGAPLVDVTVFVACGRGDEPLGVPGTMALLLRSAFSAGAGALEPAAQVQVLDRIGLQPTLAVDDGESWIDFAVETRDLPEAMALLNDALSTPRFDPEAVARATERDAALIVESPLVRHNLLSNQVHNRAIYERTPTLTQLLTPSTIQRLSPEILRAQAARCLGPRNLVVAVTGDVTEASVRAGAAPLGRLQGMSVNEHVAAGAPPTLRNVWLVATTLSSRVEVTVLGQGLPRGSKDRAAATILLAALTASIEEDLRGHMGHVYSVDGAVEVGPGTGATWIRFSTRPEVSFEAARRVLALLQAWWNWWPLDVDYVAKLVLDESKSHGRMSKFSRTFLAGRALMQDREAFDASPFYEQVAKVRGSQLSGFFAHALKPENLQLVVTGALDPSLDWKQFGKVTIVSEVPR